MGPILTKKCSSPQNEPHTAKLCFPAVLKRFGGNSLKILFVVKKVTSQKVAQKYSESLFFLTSLIRGESWGNFLICLNKYFLSNQWKGTILKKKVFLLKMSHIQLNYAFLFFWSILGEIHCKLLFLFKKVRITQKYYFSQQVWKGENPEENLDLL